jgi:serine/threonine protein kinase
MWKALRHPNVLSLLGVIMSETQFAMVSEWMSNGNINEFVKEHLNANRFELVSFPFRFSQSPLPADRCTVSVVGRCREGLDLPARSGNGPWGS